MSEISRKEFMTRISLGVAALSAAAAAIPVISALVAPLLKRGNGEWRNVGSLADFPAGSTKLISFLNDDAKPYAGVTAKTAAWLRHEEAGELIAFAANCTHLGCPVRWEEQAQLFMCPCHGGVYYKDGTVAAGPPPKPLNRYKVRVFGQKVQIQTGPLPITGITACAGVHSSPGDKDV
jgi:menaquinol-cytochrome c reductase iron-sulfur subunit